MKKIFLRNDDIREKLDVSLIEITNLCIAKKVPIIHAVEPANVSEEVVNWANDLYDKNEDLVEFIQHGYNHNVNKLYPYGTEFGKNRDYVSQLEDIKKGIILMDKYFENKWTKIMAFPYGDYNSNSLRVVNELRFIGVTTSIGYSIHSKIKDFVGRKLDADLLFGKKVSYHSIIRKKYNFIDYGVSVNIIKKYTGYENAQHYLIDDLIVQIENACNHTNVVGILLHHRFHYDNIELISDLIDYCLKKGYEFTKLKSLINE